MPLPFRKPFIHFLFLFIMAIPLTIHAKTEEQVMRTNELFTISAYCKDGPQCIFTGDGELFIVIQITNNIKEGLEIPFEYIKATGPFITLKDRETGEETPLRRNLADPQLMEKLILLAPGQSISFDWIIFDAELEQFRNQNHIDVLAEIHIVMPVRQAGSEEAVSFEGKTVLHLKSQ
ncbi:hypothetical protein [Saezia sanguinis]|uniref:hypothetical protein n=1 Tax=Saezia sanguinis TaxID=1965230 RepID=UPI0030DAB24E